MKRQQWLAVCVAYLAFVSLGLPDGLLGVAWPSMRATLYVQLDALGLLLLAGTAGYMLSSFWSGTAGSRVGVGALLASSSALVGLGLAGIMVAPAWWMAVGSGALVGLGSGGVDAGLNAHAARHFRPRLVNWLHASFGLGASGGPALMVAVLQSGRSWQWGYAIVAGVQLLLGVCFAVTRGVWRSAVAATDRPAARPSSWQTLRLQQAWLGMVVFFFYTGVEVAAGQWAYTLLTESRGVDARAAGLWVTAYWASLFLGRLVLGVVAERAGSTRLIRLGITGAILGALVVTLRAPPLAAPAGLLVIGWCLAPVFPLLISTTPDRVGGAHTADAVGFQVGAAALGVAALPGLVGLLAARIGLESIGPSLVVAATVLLLAYHRLASLPRPTPEPVASAATAPSRPTPGS